MKKKETKYQTIKRLRKEIDSHQKRIAKLDQEATGEIILSGIKRCAKEHAAFQIEDVNHLMVSGFLLHPEGKNFNDYFEVDDFAQKIRSGQVGEFHIFVQASSRHRTDLQISWPQDKSHTELKGKLHENVTKIRKFFLKYNMAVGALPIEQKKLILEGEIAVLNTLLSAVKISQVLTG
jgi:hypothetical protein